MATQLEERCPICLGSCEDTSYAMPFLHRFCYECILRWAESKPECPLCKRGTHSILHSVQADDDYREHVISPSTPPSDVIDQAEPAPSDPEDDDLQDHGSPKWWASEEVPRNPVNFFQPPNWLNSLQDQPWLLQTLQSWFHQGMVETFSCGLLETAMGIHRLDTEQPVWMLGASFQNPEAPGPRPAPCDSPDTSSVDDLPINSSAALAGGPSRHRSAPAAIPAEQEEPQQEPGEAVPGPSTSRRGRHRSPGRTRRPQKRRTGRSQGSPASKRPAPPC
ncbi:uncharacterized protein LOC142358909 [Opisthocomus hoazin]|uniref:uncharacterized protein LOC142358909 n=1 Tax=Opisthocomus hoazin TaxID=30419 RepID=UPI003F52CF41